MLLEIDTQSQTPIYQQIYNQVIVGIARNELQTGEVLPSVRQMADEIGVNMMTVSKAYTLLKNDGYILTDRRNGTRVAEKQSLTPAFQEQFLKDLELLLAVANVHQLSEKTIQEDVKQIYKKFEQ
ncbi:GntR family transcriptional regulator [Enterococcus crotali]|uniref:GntR family transcriptional regulator n=1 Tax=Enterococcus crotali TaxID=1453587 RepID=UPI00046E830E|nr:GntR family transcriptional regulator [Enterococcus crotali]